MKTNKYFVWLLIIVMCSTSIFYLLILKYQNENPKIEWANSSDALIISYERRYHIDYNYIPAFRVWGDGYYVWLVTMPDKSRKVYEGYLIENELKDLLESFVDAGFFKHCHQNQGYALDYIQINLLEKNCSSLIDFGGIYNTHFAAIADLVDSLMSGLGKAEQEFTPTVSQLYVVAYEKTEYYSNQPIIQPIAVWPSERFGYEIEDIPSDNPDIREKEIVGDELIFMWKLVNSPEPFIVSNGRIYWVAVIIPKISD